jgi:16S rRNA (cytidine1402-2'-O)-methyltransferase
MYTDNQVIKSPNHKITKSQNKGALYVVGTPIGNLKDLGIRAKEVLGQVSLVAAEDTRSTRKLLTHLGVKAGLLSCHKHNERTSAKKVITLLEKGKDVALVSEAGTPALSDPGAGLVKLVREAGFGVIPVPGASAVITALSVAGMPAGSFFFAGFLPNKQAERRKALEQLAEIPHTIVLFEAPHRLPDALEDILGILGDRQMVMARELTKIHETVISGPVSGIMEQVSKGSVRGEITLVIEGAEEDRQGRSCHDPEAVGKALQHLISEKSLSVRDSVDLLVRLTGMTKGQVYPLALEIKQKESESKGLPGD